MKIMRNKTDFGRVDHGGYIICEDPLSGNFVMSKSGEMMVFATEQEAQEWIDEPKRQRIADLKAELGIID
jgi:hypothetical protein